MAHKVVTIGGGTGTFVVLSALRKLPTLTLTAIVSSADDGGSTGRLRDAYGFLPAGDARQALVALAEDGNVLRDLFAYRFTKSEVAGHNLGNLFLTALTDLLGSDSAALEEASKILRVCGKVIPATKIPATLIATLADGSTVRGENTLDEHTPGRPRITKLSYEVPTPASPAALEAVHDADILFLGPGDLYASSIAPLLAEGLKDAVKESKGKIVYIMNLFTKSGQTGGMRASDYLAEITRYAGKEPSHILLHANGGFADEVLQKYRQEGESPVEDDLGDDPRVHRASIASVHVVPPVLGDPVPRSLARHDPEKLSIALATLLS
ncbi:MAG: gluconeogenesis factor YvcK family protein [Minisyncoccia bacterium]